MLDPLTGQPWGKFDMHYLTVASVTSIFDTELLAKLIEDDKHIRTGLKALVTDEVLEAFQAAEDNAFLNRA